MGRIVGVDYGTVRLGVAISDESKIVARVLTTLLAEKKIEATADKLLQELSKLDVEQIVIGLPLRMNGKMGPMGDEVQHFVELLKTKLPYPVVLWDERLTTVQADRLLRESNLNRKKRSKVIDSMTAVILLQSYLDSLR
jgi:putative Holliday junction resolvase